MEKVSVSCILTDKMKAHLKDFTLTSTPLMVESNLIHKLSSKLVEKFKDNIVIEYRPDLQQTTYNLKIGVQPLGFSLPTLTCGGDYLHKEELPTPPDWEEKSLDSATWTINPEEYGIAPPTYSFEKIKTDMADKIKELMLHSLPGTPVYTPLYPHAPDQGWIPPSSPSPKITVLVPEEVNKELGEIWRVLVKHGMGWEDRKEIFDSIKKLCVLQGEK